MPKFPGQVPRRQPTNKPTQQEFNAFLARYNAGDMAAAAQLAKVLTRRFPNHGFGWKALGIVAMREARHEDALVAMRQAVKLDPNDPAANSNLGVICRALGRLDEAERGFRASIRLNPNDAAVHYNLGNTLSDLARADQAETSFREAIRIDPHSADAHLNLGNALKEQGRMREAEDSYRDAIRLMPDHSGAHCNLGIVLNELARVTEGEKSFRTALELSPDDAFVHNSLGMLLMGMGRFSEAEDSFRRSLAITPDYVAAFDNLLFVFNYHPDKTAEEVAAAYAEYDRRFGSPHRDATPPHANASAAGRRLKIGYVSADFRHHSTRYFLEPLLANHDRTSFEIFAYATLDREDAVTARYKRCVDNWIATAGMSDDAFCARIRADAIDILVDLAGHTAGNRLGVFARKPAPVAVSWLGYASTTGMRAIDYLLVDPVSAPPGSEPHFAETPWRIETPAYVYRPPEDTGPEGALPAQSRGFVTFGTLTRAVRINARTLRVWARILDAVPRSQLVVDSFSFSDPDACKRLEDRLAAEGLARERIRIGFRSPPWDVLRGIDIGLDCFPHNSGVTLFETLYMGVPYVTLAGRPSVGLIGSSILEGAGHPEWIARSEDEYVHIAKGLAADVENLAAIRSKLRTEMASRPIMDERGFAARVETAYRQMFEIWEGKRAAAPP